MNSATNEPTVENSCFILCITQWNSKPFPNLSRHNKAKNLIKLLQQFGYLCVLIHLSMWVFCVSIGLEHDQQLKPFVIVFLTYWLTIVAQLSEHFGSFCFLNGFFRRPSFCPSVFQQTKLKLKTLAILWKTQWKAKVPFQTSNAWIIL